MKPRKSYRHNQIRASKNLKELFRADQKNTVNSYWLGRVRRWGREKCQIRHRRHIFWIRVKIERLLKKKGVRYSEYFDD